MPNHLHHRHPYRRHRSRYTRGESCWRRDNVGERSHTGTTKGYLSEAASVTEEPLAEARGPQQHQRAVAESAAGVAIMSEKDPTLELQKDISEAASVTEEPVGRGEGSTTT